MKILKKLISIIGSPGIEILIVIFNLLISNLVHVHNFSNSKAKMFYINQAKHASIEVNSLREKAFSI